jgi:hypothetical protein
MPANQPIPWGDTREIEDFGTDFNDWVNESAAPRLNPNQSTSILEQAVYAASQGHTILLQKLLLMAALFTDQATQQLSLYSFPNYTLWAGPIQRTLGSVQATSSSLTLNIPLAGGGQGGYTFTIQSGALTSVTSPASQVTVSGNVVSIPALSDTFPTPVPIPGFAASAWGIH